MFLSVTIVTPLNPLRAGGRGEIETSGDIKDKFKEEICRKM
jgi:hypothetical protein